MSSYNELIALINGCINRNGVQAITGRVLNGVLRAMVNQLGAGYAMGGVAHPTDDPGTPEAPVCYYASEVGTYTHFGNIQIVPGELALLCFDLTDGWFKETMYEGFESVQATIDGNVGTPAVNVTYVNGVLSFDFSNMKGNTGAAAGFGNVTAAVDGTSGTPGVSVQTDGPDTAKNIAFQFTGLKGETGVTSVIATVDNTSGTPQCAVSLNGQQLTLAFTGLKGAQGDTGSSVAYPFTIVNNLTTNDATQALSAAMGVQLESEVSQLEAEMPYKTEKKGGKNLLDLSVITRNKSFNSSGVISDNANYSISGFIPISPSTDYCYSRKGSSSSPGGSQYVCFYDSNKDFVSSLIPSGLTFTSPAGVAYMRVTLYNNYITDANELMVETGTTRGPYKAFNPIGGYPLPERAEATLENKVNIKPGKNLIDVSAAIPGLISDSTGDVVSSTTYHISDFIPVTAGQSYRFTRAGSTSYPGGSNYAGYYDADKKFLSAEIPGSATLTIPSGASYVRVPIYNNYLSDDIQFEAGTTRTAYQPYSPVGGYPSGPADISGSLVQTTGTATDKAMSQKATTDAINAAVSGIDVSTAINRMKYAQIVGDENKLYVQKDFSINPSDYTTTRAVVASENGKLKITCDTVYSYHIAWLDFTQNPLDLSNSQFGIDLDVVEGTSGTTDYYTEIDEIDIMLCSEDTKRTDENSYRTLDAYPVIVNALYILHPGEYKANAPLYLARNGVVHTVDLTGIKWVAIRIKTIKHTEPGRTDYDGTPSIIVNRLFTFAKPRRRQVLFGFDGGYTGQIDAGDYLASKGLFGTFFVTRYHIGDEGHISASQLHTLKNAGHLIGMYSAPSPWKGWYDMTLVEKKAAIVDQAEWLYENGFGDGALYASVPGGGYSGDEDVLFTQGKIKMLTGRSLYSKYDTVCGFYGPYSTGHSCGPSVPTSDRKDAIDALIEDGGFCIFIFHQCTGQADDISLADFQEIVDYVVAKRDAGLLEVVTANDFKTYTLSTAPQSE